MSTNFIGLFSHWIIYSYDDETSDKWLKKFFLGLYRVNICFVILRPFTCKICRASLSLFTFLYGCNIFYYTPYI